MPSTQPATTTPPATLPSTLPDGIEIFRAGRHLDDAGVAHHFSEADLDGMAQGFEQGQRFGRAASFDDVVEQGQQLLERAGRLLAPRNDEGPLPRID